MKHSYISIISLVFISLFGLKAIEFIEIPFDNYYNITKVNSFLEFSNQKPTNDLDFHYLYYPSICNNSSINSNKNSGLYSPSLFSWGSETIPVGSSILIKKDTHVVSNSEYPIIDKFDFICVEGFLEIFGSPVNVGAIIILNGGVISFLNSNLAFSPLSSKYIDPFFYFPGILNLGGSFVFNGSSTTSVEATRIGENLLKLKSNVNIQPDFPFLLFSESSPGQKVYLYSISNNQLSYSGIDIPPEDKSIVIFFYKNFIRTSSVFMGGNSKATIRNTFLEITKGTTNDYYNDTTIEVSSDDSSIATKVNLGSNQRFRSALSLQFTQDAVIENCAFISSDNNRSPIIAFASSLNISNSFVSSKSGSNIIAQYGTELIYSQNNHYYLQQADISPQQVPPASSMDYGYEGNGIYSLSPNISSTNDVFYGQKNAIHFNFISNRSSITGLDKDCYLPCTSESSGVSNSVQYPIEFKINNPTFYQLDTSRSSTLKQYLIRINNNGNLPSRIFTIKDLELSTPISIFANLQDSTLLLDNIKSSNDFSIDGSITKLQIQNSKFNSSSNNNAVILSTSIQNTLFSGKLKDINIPTNQNYGSISTPYLYSNEETSENITINSIYPSTPYQMNINTTLNIKVSFTTPLDISSFQCIFGNSINGEINETFSHYTSLLESECQFEFKPRNEGIYNLFIIIRADDNDYYFIVYPKLVSFPKYRFYSGLYFNPSSSTLQVNIEGNIFISGCVKPYCTFIEESNLKYSSLPNSLEDSNPFKEIVKYGLTTNNELKPLEIQFILNPNSLDYQIQLYFVYYQPIDDYGSPLSIYINDEPIIVFDIVNQESTFNNISFYYNNSKRLSYANLKIQNRGDIYLTSIIVYSNVESLTPPSPIPKDYKYLIKILVPIGCIVIIVVALFIIVNRKYRWPNRKFFSLLYYNYFGTKSQLLFNSTDYDEYQVHSSVYELLQNSKFYPPNSKSFPLSLSTYKLDFGLNGSQSKIGVLSHDQITITNVSKEQVKCLLLLPPQNNGVECSADFIGIIEPGESKVITFSIKVSCTIKFLEKAALFVEGIGHTFICLHIESTLSPLLDISEFEFESILGEGTFGIVFEAQWRGSNTAVKIIKQSQPKINKREVKILSDMKHPNIVTYIGAISNFHCLGLVTEFAKYGSLQTVLYDTPNLKLSTIQKLNIAIDIARGCAFLHQHGIIHRDLKPGNILIVNIADTGVCAKVSDFGSSRYWIFDTDVALTNNVGTPMYMGNEVLCNEGYDASADVYSFGILLYELMTGLKPFTGLTGFSIPQYVARGGRPKEGLEHVDSDLYVIMQACWDYRPRKRPSFRNIVILLQDLYYTLLSEREHLMDRMKERENLKENGESLNSIEMDSIEGDNKFLKINDQENAINNLPKQLLKRKRYIQLPKSPLDEKKQFIISDKYQNINQNAIYSTSKEEYRVSIKFERSIQNGISHPKVEEFERLMKCAFVEGAHKLNKVKKFTTDTNLLKDINPKLNNSNVFNPSDENITVNYNKDISLNLDGLIKCIDIPDIDDSSATENLTITNNCLDNNNNNNNDNNNDNNNNNNNNDNNNNDNDNNNDNNNNNNNNNNDNNNNNNNNIIIL